MLQKDLTKLDIKATTMVREKKKKKKKTGQWTQTNLYSMINFLVEIDRKSLVFSWKKR